MLKTSKTDVKVKKCQVLFIGAGFSGSLAALEYAKHSKEGKIILIDQNPDVVGRKSSSFNECYKLHTGAHYAGDLVTAKECLIDSIHFARNYPEFILGDLNDPWRRGVHFVMSNSLYPLKEVKKVCQRLQKLYAKKVNEDKENKVFGDIDNFIRFIEVGSDEFHEKFSHVNRTIICEDKDGIESEAQIVGVIETAESQLDVVAFKKYLNNLFSLERSKTDVIGDESSFEELEVEGKSKVKFIGNLRVDRISYSEKSLSYNVEATSLLTNEKIYFETDAVVNSTWNNIEVLDKQLGLHGIHREDEVATETIIRTKVSILVVLPSELTKMNTCIFSIGPHCSITNLGDGTAILTYEPVTNVGEYKAGDEIIPKILKKLQRNDLNCHEGIGKALAEKILEGCIRYVPSIANAVIKDIRVGHVKMMLKPGEIYSIDSADSPIHRRQEDGIEVKDLCYFSLSGMKATRTQRNAQRLAEMINRNLFIRELIYKEIAKIQKNLLRNLSFLTFNFSSKKHESSSAKLQKHSVNPPFLYMLYHSIKRLLLAELEKKSLSYEETSFDDDYISKLAYKIRKAILIKGKTTNLIESMGRQNISFWRSDMDSITQSIKLGIKDIEREFNRSKNHTI